MDHWTLGSQTQVTTYIPLQRYKFPTRPGAPCLWHETQGRRFRNPDTWCDARRNRHSRSTSEALDGGLATGSGLVGRNTAAAANLCIAIGAPKTMETNTGHSGMELPERSTPFSFDTWLLPTEVTMRFRNCWEAIAPRPKPRPPAEEHMLGT